jgi:hypothetical protein
MVSQGDQKIRKKLPNSSKIPKYEKVVLLGITPWEAF